MFQRLGLGGASSMLGGFAILFIPAPFIFIKYDARIRAASKFTTKVTPAARAQEMEMRA
jgi:DHA1 family multidrug resistance protein-like MFS transporter